MPESGLRFKVSETDVLSRFLFEGNRVRGEIVHLDASWRAVQGAHDYPQAVRSVLGEAVAAAALLTPTLKFEGKLHLQVSGEGAIPLLLVQCTSDHTLRGLARWSQDMTDEPAPAPFRDARLAITVDPTAGRERYQGIVEVSGPHIGVALEDYFLRSEQLETRLWLAADSRRAAGLLLQRLPGEAEDADAWNRVQQLAATVTSREILELAPQTLMHLLFSEEDLRLFEPMPFSFRCGCSRSGIETLLRGMGLAEVRAILAEQGEIEVSCEFCAQRYRFDAVDAEGLFAAVAPTPGSGSQH